MSRIFLIIVSLVMLVSCGRKTGDQGSHLPPKMMQQVLMDINMAEAFSTVVRDSVHKPGTKNIDSLALYYTSVFNHYKITSEQFNESMEWYKNHPEKLDSMYTSLLATVTTLQNKIVPVPAATNKAMPVPPPALPPHFIKPGERIQPNVPVVPGKQR